MMTQRSSHGLEMVKTGRQRLVPAQNSDAQQGTARAKGLTRMGDVQHYSRRTRKKNLSQSG